MMNCWLLFVALIWQCSDSEAGNFGAKDVVPELAGYSVADVSVFVVVLHVVLFHGLQVSAFVIEVVCEIMDHVVA